MAGRTLYWNPPAAANWTDANVWSLTDGGTRNQSTPDSTDDCIFTNTNNYNCSISATSACRDVTFAGGTGYTGTFASNSSTFNIYGSLTFSSTMTVTATNMGLTFVATSGTKTITSAGKQIGTITFNGSGGTFRLADSISIATGITLTAGTFDATTNSTTVTFNGSSISGDFTGSNSFYSLTITGAAGIGAGVTFDNNVTATNTLTINGNSGINRIFVRSNTIGTARTLTAATVSVTNADFQDITGAGAGSWDLSAITGGSGDCCGNTNITFTTADDWYWHVDTGDVSNYAKWYTETNGGGSQMASTRVPLPQDTLHFDSSSFDSGSKVITQNMPRIGSIDFTGATNTPTFTTSTTASVFGSLTLISGMTLTASTQGYTFQGRNYNSMPAGGWTLTSAGKTWAKSIIVNNVDGTLKLLDSLTSGVGNNFVLTSGTFDANDQNVTIGSISSAATGVRTLTMGDGTWEFTRGDVSMFSVNITNLTLNKDNSTIKFTGTLTGNQNVSAGGGTYNNFWNATTGSYALVIQGSNTFNDFKIDAGREVNFTAGTTTTVTTFTALGTSGSHIVVHSTSATDATLTKAGGGLISGCDYVDMTDIVGSPANTWYIGANSTATGCTNIYTLDEPVATATGNFFAIL